MNMSVKSVCAAVAATLLAPAMAHAGLILDTGTPAGSTTFVLNSSQWVAAEFSASAGETINDLAAYLAPESGSVTGQTYTFDIFNASGFTSTRVTTLNAAPVYSVTGTLTASGWNTTAANWTVGTSGNYWVALEVSNAGSNNGIDLLGETSATTGSAPAAGFAYYGSGTNAEFTTTGAPTFGVQISAVPLPPALWMLGGGLVGLGALARRRRA